MTRPPRRPQHHQQQVPPPLPTPGAGAGLSSPLRSPRRPPPPSAAAVPAVRRGLRAADPGAVRPRSRSVARARLGERGSPTVAAATGGSDALTDRCSARAPLPRGHVLRGGVAGGAGLREPVPAGGGRALRARRRGLAAADSRAGWPGPLWFGATVRYGPGLPRASTTAHPTQGFTSFSS